MSDVYKAPEAPLNEPIAQGEYGSVERALAGQYNLNPTELISQAWKNLGGLKTPLWIALVIYIVAVSVLTYVLGMVFGVQAPGQMPGIGQVLSQILQIFIMAPLGAGLFMIGVKHSVGGKAEFGEIFKHFDKIIPLFLTTILSYILIGIGLVLLVIPGLYLMVAYSMALPLVIEKRMGVWQALETSRKAVSKKWFNMLGMIVFVTLVVLLGAVALLVGLIWAIPVATLAFAMVYRDMFGVEESTLSN